MKVKILGTEYEIVINAEEKDYPKLKMCDGYTDTSIKKIVVRKLVKDEETLEDVEKYSKKVLRHEIVHAFMHESGLDIESPYARNEELIDWIAIQFEKMLGVFIEVKAINSIGIDINVFDRTSNNPINDPSNLPKVKEAKACIQLPDLTIPNIEIPKYIGDVVNKSSMYGGDG